MILQALIVAASTALLTWTAGAAAGGTSYAYAHLAIAAAAGLAMAVIAVRDIGSRSGTDGASPAAVAATAARHMVVVWAWGALAIGITYATGLLAWKEWWQFFLAFTAAAGLSLVFAWLLHKDATNPGADETMLRLGRILAYVQLFGMLAVMIGLVIDGKMPANFAAKRPWQDWGANHIFFFGALALAVISIRAIRNQPQSHSASGGAA